MEHPQEHRPLSTVPEIVLDARVVASKLGLTAEKFMAELQKGIVHQVTEQGAEEDDGRYRVIFRYRSMECRFVLSAEGRVLDTA